MRHSVCRSQNRQARRTYLVCVEQATRQLGSWMHTHATLEPGNFVGLSQLHHQSHAPFSMSPTSTSNGRVRAPRGLCLTPAFAAGGMHTSSTNVCFSLHSIYSILCAGVGVCGLLACKLQRLRKHPCLFCVLVVASPPHNCAHMLFAAACAFTHYLV